ELLDRAMEYLESVSGSKYAENICPIVVDSMTNKLKISGWSTTPDSKEATDQANTIWDWNNLDDEFKTAISRTCELGDGFLIVDYDPDAGMPTISFNPPDMVKAEYSPSNPKEMVYATKRWNDS